MKSNLYRVKMNFYQRSIKFFLICFLCITSVHADIERRAALDIGSAETKLTIADVDTEINKIVTIYFQDYKSVELRKYLASNSEGLLNKEIEDKLVTVLNNYKNAASELAPDQWFGIGTSVFRNAKNGQEFLDSVQRQTGIKLHLASQSEEGEIGFKTAVAASGLDADQVIAWDSGNGSFQITIFNDGQPEIYGAEFAFVPALELLIKTIRGETFSTEDSPNPISMEEIISLSTIIQEEKLPPIPDWLKHTNKKIISFGGKTSMFLLGQIATGKEIYEREDIYNALQLYANKSDDQLGMFPEPHKAVVALTLLYSVMNYCSFNEMLFSKTNGSCEGLLIIPDYWQ